MLGDHLLHPCGTGSEDGEFVERVVGEFGVDELGEVQDVHIIRIGVEKRLGHARRAIEIALLVIQAGKLHADLHSQVLFRKLRIDAFESSFRRTAAHAILADAQHCLGLQERWINGEGALEILACGWAIALEEAHRAAIGKRRGVLGIDCEDGIELVYRGVCVVRLKVRSRLPKVLLNLRGAGRSGLRGREGERAGEKCENQNQWPDGEATDSIGS